MVSNKEIKLPFYARFTIFLIGIFVMLIILYIAQNILIPLVIAMIIAVMLHPVVIFFRRFRIHRILAIVITILLALAIIAVFGALLYSQASRFIESLPILINKFTELINQTVTWISQYFNINPVKIHDWIANTKESYLITSRASIGQTLVDVGSGLVVLVLIPVYIFMILFYQPLLLEFFRRLFGKSNRTEVSEIIVQIKLLIQRYLIGLLIEAAIVATLYSIGLLILGIEYAIMLGIIGAILNLIPYIGSMIAASLPMIIALLTKSSPWYALLVMAVYIFIQLIDNNYLVPKIVASKVKINALLSIIVVIIGNALWDIPGMLLSIPLIAIIKLIFDHIEPLKPWGYLLGDNMPPLSKVKPFFEKRKSIS
ncbi:MAG: AI-2E family transporter [Bacteroidales bacterium]|nr:AI-2E family transporter [Bacteroidales bacterium]